jgi:plasmid stability protein
MGQMTWRAPDELLQRVRVEAARHARSMNDYVTAVLDAATDPALEGSEAEQLRARLAAAGLLAATGSPRRRPPATKVAAARRSAGKGTPLSQLVSEGRR